MRQRRDGENQRRTDQRNRPSNEDASESESDCEKIFDEQISKDQPSRADKPLFRYVVGQSHITTSPQVSIHDRQNMFDLRQATDRMPSQEEAD